MSDKRLDQPLIGSATDTDAEPGNHWTRPDAGEMMNLEDYQPAGDMGTQRERKTFKASPVAIINSPSGRKWFSWWNKRKTPKKPDKTYPTWHGRQYPLQSFVQQPLAPSSPVRPNTLIADSITGDVVETLLGMYEQAGFGNTRRDRYTSRSATVRTRRNTERSSFVSQPEEVHPIIENGFVSIQDLPYTDVDLHVTDLLGTCNKYVMGPYNCLLKAIGWRAWRSSQNECYHRVLRVCDIIYPLIIFLIMLITSVTQIFICFSRTRAAPPPTSNASFAYLSCDQGVLTSGILPDAVILVSYVWALFVFRKLEPENLSTLIATVFLSYDICQMGKSQRKMILILISFLLLGIVWMVFSSAVNIVRLFSLQLDSNTTVIHWVAIVNAQEDPTSDGLSSQQNFDEETVNSTTYQAQRLTFSIISLVGFLVIDLLYVAVMINYSCQCELLKAYIGNVKVKTHHKSYLLGDSVKEINRIGEFMRILNGHLSHVTSLVLFVVVIGVCLSILQLTRLSREDAKINIAVGFLNIIQWSIIALVPIVQAARLTSECRTIRVLGLEIGARPFVFSDTPQLVLDSFINYTSAVNYKAKLAFVPIYPEAVLGLAFFTIIAISVALQEKSLVVTNWI